MKALLIINEGKDKKVKVIVKLQKQALIERVNRLTREERVKEAFNLLLENAQVEEYIPPGQNVKEAPELTLIEGAL